MQGIDPNIPLSVQPFKGPNIGQAIQQAQGFRLNDMKMQQAQQQLDQEAQAKSDQDAYDNAYKIAAKPDGSIDQAALLNAVPGHMRSAVQSSLLAYQKSLSDIQKTRLEAQKLSDEHDLANRNALGALALGVKSHGYDPGAFTFAVSRAMKDGLIDKPTAQQYIQNLTPDKLPAALDDLIRQSPEASKLDMERNKPVDVSAGGSLVNTNGPNGKPQVLYQAPTKPVMKEVVVPGPNGPVTKLFTEEEMKNGVPTYRAPVGAADAASSARQASDVQEIVSGYKDGTTPVNPPGRATKEYTAIQAEAHRQGFDLAKAQGNFIATQAAIKSLNSTQQMRLTENISKAVNMLPHIEELNNALETEMKSFSKGKVQFLNRGLMELAKNGGYGDNAKQIALNLDSQIADFTSDLGNVYMGGNTPTDQGLKLASKNLNSDWDKNTFNAAIKQARFNLNLANSARNDLLDKLGVTATQFDALPKTAQFSVSSPDGKLHSFPSQQALDDFKKAAGIK